MSRSGPDTATQVPKFQEIYKYILARCSPEAVENSFKMDD